MPVNREGSVIDNIVGKFMASVASIGKFDITVDFYFLSVWNQL